MRRLDYNEIRNSLIDIASYDLKLGGADIIQTGELPQRIAKLLTSGPGYCVCYGTGKVLSKHGKNVEDHREEGYGLLESIFRGAMALIDFEKFCVTPRAMTMAKMDVDGYNLNRSFSHDSKIPARAFMTAKCIHFDAATPFVANTYGPNENIDEGYPLICDVQRFCEDRGLKPADLVQPIPNNYNIVLKEEFYGDLMEDYSFGLNLNLRTDIIIVMLLNEIQYGVAHGATPPRKSDEDLPCHRPLRHFEYQYAEESHYEEWYGYYRLAMSEASDYKGENLSLFYYSPARPFENIINVEN